MLQGKLYRSFQKTFLATAIVALTQVFISVNGLIAYQAGDSVSQLQFAPYARHLTSNVRKNSWRQNVPASYRHARWSCLRRWLFDHCTDVGQAFAGFFARHNSVAPRVLQRHFLNGQH